MKKLMLITVVCLFAACQKQDDLVNPGTSPVNQGTDQLTEPTEAEIADAERRGFKLLKLHFNGLEKLGWTARYEGWIIVNGNPVSTGRFFVLHNGKIFPKWFLVKAHDLNAASAFVLTIEPFPDPDPAPSDVHLLAGDFNGKKANLTVGHPAAIGNDFSAATGKFILATPTTASTTDEDKGVWFIDAANGLPGFSLPSLPAGWKYEGWTVINGVPVSTGTFLAANAADDAAPFSGPLPGPPFPGEDFIMNAPSGLSFPPQLAGAPVVLSIEPVPDNSPAPFTLKPLAGSVPANPAVHTVYSMSNNTASFPEGIARR